jgi:hypothetical protein
MITSVDLAKIQRKDNNNVVDLITFAFFALLVHLSTKNLPFSLRLHVTSIYHHERKKKSFSRTRIYTHSTQITLHSNQNT